MRLEISARTTAPPERVEYFLDCAQDAGELDACTAMTLRLYDRDAAAAGMIGTLPANSKYRDREGLCLRLAALADGVLVRLPPARRAGLVHVGLRFLGKEIISRAEVYAAWAITDTVEGGCLLPFRNKLRMRRGQIFRRTDRRLHSPRFVRRYVKNASDCAHLTSLVEIATRRAEGIIPAPDPGIWQEVRAQVSSSDRRCEPVLDRPGRRAVRRSLRLAEGVVGHDVVVSFLRGEEIKLVGEEVVVLVRKRGLLSDRGHGCLSVALASRSGARLADLCAYVQDTNTLDQLAALALWVAAGEESKILEVANVTRLEPSRIEHPLLKAHAERRRLARNDDLADALARGLVSGAGWHRPRRSHEETTEMCARYWAATGKHWVEALLRKVAPRCDVTLLTGAMQVR